MALCPLCLGLVLLGALKTQAQEPLPTSNSTTPLRKLPLQPDFQYEQFQGRWYCIGIAQNTHLNESENTVLQNTFYELNDDYSFNVTADWVRNGKCEHDIGVIFPTDEPGLFSLQNVTRYGGVQNFTVRVLKTDYKQFAMVYLQRIVHDTVYFKHVLYGRSKELSPEVKEQYRAMAKSLGVPDGYIIFPDQHVDCSVQ